MPYQSEKERCTALQMASKGKSDFQLISAQSQFVELSSASFPIGFVQAGQAEVEI